MLLQVDMVCGDHLLDHDQSLKQIQSTMGEEAVQVRTLSLTHTVSQVDPHGRDKEDLKLGHVYTWQGILKNGYFPLLRLLNIILFT